MATLDVEPIDQENESVNVIIDTPRGSRAKYKFETQSGLLHLSKLLPLGACFPFNFGFIPHTRGEDGDELDVMVLMDESTIPGCIVPVRIIGVLEAEQRERDGNAFRNDRLLGVLETDYNPPPVHSIDELDNQQIEEIEHFFIGYNKMEGRRYIPIGRAGRKKAMALIKESIGRYDGKSQKK